MSYHDSHDYRQSRRHDSCMKPGEYLSPSTPSGGKAERSGSVHDATSSRQPNRSYYEKRQRSPYSGRSSDDQRMPLRGSRRRSRNAWPPVPTVESEARSLAREVDGHKLLRELRKSEIPSRGTIDQDPVIEEVAEYANLHERRFVMLSDSDSSRKSKGRGMPTPPTSEDEQLKQARRRPSRIATDFDNMPPVMQSRTATPYSLSKPAASRSKRSSGEASPADKSGSTFGPHQRQEARGFSDGIRPRRDLDPGAASADGRRPLSRDGGVGIDRDTSSAVKTSGAASKESRRSTDAAAASPRPGGSNKTYRPTPLVVAGAIGEAARIARDQGLTTPRSASLNPPTLSREASLGSCNVSPASQHSRRSMSPPSRSPRYSQEISREQNSSPDSKRASVVGSRSGSRPGSRPGSRNGSPPPPPFASVAMPRAPQMPSTDLDWNDLLVANAAHRGAAVAATATSAMKKPSRLSTSMRADSTPAVSRSASASMSSRPSALPYPINDGPMTPDFSMPVEQDHQWYPGPQMARTAQFMPEQVFEQSRQVQSPASIIGNPLDARPPRPSRHSFANPLPVEPKPLPPRTEIPARSSFANAVGPSKQEAEAMLKRGLPGCSRPNPVAHYDEWYTLIGASELDFCPNCIESIFERTVYRKYFRRSLPRDLNTKIGCAFGGPWIRLAYLLTVQQRQPDLQLFKDLVNIDTSGEQCAGDQEAVRTWYGLRDNQGLFVRDFQVCYADVRKLERLLPTFSGFFQRLPDRASYEMKRCSLRADTNRFTQYLNSIIELHDQAHATRTLPERMPFVLLVERKLALRECERDALLLDSLWHYMPSLPQFTVCEDCFDEVVEPELRSGSDIAKRFHGAVQPAYGEVMGTSCQLYSPRMRKVFIRAIRDNDLKYLTRKAKARREAELRLQEQQAIVVRRLERYESQGRGVVSEDEDNKRRLARDLRHIIAEWKEDWE